MGSGAWVGVLYVVVIVESLAPSSCFTLVQLFRNFSTTGTCFSVVEHCRCFLRKASNYLGSCDTFRPEEIDDCFLLLLGAYVLAVLPCLRFNRTKRKGVITIKPRPLDHNDTSTLLIATIFSS
ncbi:hypothetical protein AVEN_79687-1 [Araneus ventricosus]|uniref:Uncharacterized protein n=1 Tax=Araneus ventricosus TaxID=182803 RepID=A0A4Y2JQ97_ARAVE|nr:hypothetical protein AVEN_79687-1 [Araneus ventricosus]